MLALLIGLCLLQAPPDEAACVQFAKKLEESMGRGDGALADQLLDRAALIDRALQEAPGEAKSRQEFRAGALKTFALGKAIAKVVREQQGTYTFLRLRPDGNRRRALFRLVLGDTFNYHDFLLEAPPGGALRATDVHVLLSGEWMSETFRRAYFGMVQSEPGVLGKLSGKQNEYAESLNRINRMTQLRQAGKAAEALEVYAALPAAAKKEKMALLVRYQAALEAAPEQLPEILEAFEKAHPGDACLPAISIGAHLQAGRHAKALSAVDAVDASVGGDPYLDVQRASIHFQGKALDQAKAAATRAIRREKSLKEAYWTLITISLQEKSYADTAKWLSAVETDLGLELNDLAEIEEYAGFVKSADYLAWKKAREKK